MKSGLLLFICICVMGCASVPPSQQQDEISKLALIILDNSTDLIHACANHSIKVDSLKIRNYLDTTDSFMKYFRTNKLNFRIIHKSTTIINNKTEHEFMARADDETFSANLSLIIDNNSNEIELGYIVCYQWFEN